MKIITNISYLVYRLTDSTMLMILTYVNSTQNAGKDNVQGAWFTIYPDKDLSNLSFEGTERIKILQVESCACPDINTHINSDAEINCGQANPLKFLSIPKVINIGELKGLITPAKYRETYDMLKGFIDAYIFNKINIPFMDYLKDSIPLQRYEMSLKLITPPEEKKPTEEKKDVK